MLRLLCRQTSRTLSRPLHISLRRYRHFYSDVPPYAAPPSSEALRQRFPEGIEPGSFFSERSQSGSGIVDKWSYVPVGDGHSENTSISTPDVSHEILNTAVSELFRIPYLSQATAAESRNVIQRCSGRIYGAKRRTIMPLVVNHNEEARWVFFICNSGIPLTYLSQQACNVLGIYGEEAGVKIGGHPHLVRPSPPGSVFSELNLLGTDFYAAHRIIKVDNYPKRWAGLYFGDEWEKL